MKRILLIVGVLLVVAMTLGVIRNGSLPALPEIVSFTATPRAVAPGGSAVLAWETRGVESVAMESGPVFGPRGNMELQKGLPPSGMMTVHPKESTVYVLECETSFGTMCMSQSVTIQVNRH
jgi:hypothetical protein